MTRSIATDREIRRKRPQRAASARSPDRESRAREVLGAALVRLRACCLDDERDREAVLEELLATLEAEGLIARQVTPRPDAREDG